MRTLRPLERSRFKRTAQISAGLIASPATECSASTQARTRSLSYSCPVGAKRTSPPAFVEPLFGVDFYYRDPQGTTIEEAAPN
jgi:hypothetical protein